jgi:putative ABC transport system permease protein
VLGLSSNEVGRILYEENVLLGLVGIVWGIPLGIGVSRLLVEAFDTDMFRLPFYIARQTYGISILLTLFFVLLANLAIRRKIMRLDLVEVLKERE